MTCPRKYCLVEKCTYDADADIEQSAEPDNEVEPDPDEDTERFPAYQPPEPPKQSEPPTLSDQVECIASNTLMYSAGLGIASVALVFLLSDKLLVVTIMFFVVMCIAVTVAAVNEQLTKRAAKPRRVLTDPPLGEPSVEPPNEPSTEPPAEPPIGLR